jgi:hypothetical protein
MRQTRKYADMLLSHLRLPTHASIETNIVRLDAYRSRDEKQTDTGGPRVTTAGVLRGELSGPQARHHEATM